MATPENQRYRLSLIRGIPLLFIAAFFTNVTIINEQYIVPLSIAVSSGVALCARVHRYSIAGPKDRHRRLGVSMCCGSLGSGTAPRVVAVAHCTGLTVA